jgi:catechol 2,3-dioxygenase-like lactoylglutathione lyase family enzyme
MILGLSHVGMTVSELGRSLTYYQETFGFRILSDAERKGEWVDKITGIPGFHTRTVYLALNPHRHLEVFGFFNPKIVLPEKDGELQVGVLYCVFQDVPPANFSKLESGEPEAKWGKRLGDLREDRLFEFRTLDVKDPDELLIRVVEAPKGTAGKTPSSKTSPLVPAFLVENIEDALHFYQSALGLEIDRQGESSPSPQDRERKGFLRRVRWVLLKAPTGTCLQLIQPLNFKILPAGPWQMQKVGFTHVAFGVQNLDPYYSQLARSKVQFKSPPQSVTAGPHQGGKAVYLNSPEGITLEFIESPLILEERGGSSS